MPVIGDNIVLTTTFTVDGTPTAPTAVVLTIKAPDGTETTPANSTSSVGVYTATVPVDQAGTWAYRWVGSGAAVGVDEGTFYVRFSLLDGGRNRPGYLCSVEDVADYMPAGQNLDFAIVDRLIASASSAIMRIAEREFSSHDSAAIERIFPVHPYRASREIPVGDMADDPEQVDLLDADGNVIAEDIAGVESLPRNRKPYEPITALRFTSGALGSADRIRVNAEWGFPQIPEDIRHACIAQVREWYVRDVQRFTPEFADEGFTAATRELGLMARDAARAYRYLMVA